MCMNLDGTFLMLYHDTERYLYGILILLVTSLLVIMTITSRTRAISLPKELWTEIDNKRADVNRSLFVRRAIEHHLHKGDKEIK